MDYSLVVISLLVSCLNAYAFTDREMVIIEEADKFFNISNKEKPRMIDNDTLRERLQKGDLKLFILDVRSEKDYLDKRIDVPKEIPMMNISQNNLFKESNLHKLPLDKDIVIVCYTDGLANKIIPFLNIVGYRAMVLTGGIERWTIQGLPSEK